MTWGLLSVVAAAMLLVRRGWAGRREWAWAGWALALAALFWLAYDDGAWGLAVGVVAGMVAVLAVLLYDGWNSPAKVQRTPRQAPAVALPRRWSDLGRRVAVFVLVVPVAFAAAQWCAFGAQALARRSGAVDADTVALTLLLQPVLWTLIMSVQMTRTGPARMLSAPGIAAVLGTLLWSVS